MTGNAPGPRPSSAKRSKTSWGPGSRRAAGCRLHQRRLDGPDDRDLIEQALRGSVPQSPRAADAQPTRLLRPATPQATGASRPGGAGDLAPRDVPSDQKKAAACRGVVMFGDEASFWLDGTLHRTWARVGHQPHVDTFGMRKTAHVFGALSLESARASTTCSPTVFKAADLPAVPQVAGAPQPAQDLPHHRQRPLSQPRRGGEGMARAPIGTASRCSASRPTRPTSTPSKEAGRRPRSERPTTASSTPLRNGTRP